MRDDIETLLQGAGAEPTRELDPSEVHAAGRRRATTRRVASGAGALALLAVVAVGLPQLTSGTQDVDVLPEPPSSTAPTPVPTGSVGDGTAVGDVPPLASYAGVWEWVEAPEGVEPTTYVLEVDEALEPEPAALAGRVTVSGPQRQLDLAVQVTGSETCVEVTAIGDNLTGEAPGLEQDLLLALCPAPDGGTTTTLVGLGTSDNGTPTEGVLFVRLDPSTGLPVDGEAEGGDGEQLAANVTGVGSTLVELSQAAAFGPVTVTTTTPGGAVGSYATTTGPLDLAYGIAVDGDGRVVYVDEDGVLTRADAASTAPVRSAEEGPWRVVGPTPDGDTWVTRGAVPELSVLTDTDVVPDPSGLVASTAEGGLTRATSSDGTTLVVEVFAGEGGEDWVAATGGTTEVVLTQGPIGFPQDDQTDVRIEPTYVGDELWWVLQRGEEEPVHDLQVQTGDGTVLTVPTPVGRDGVRRLLDVTLGTMPDGGPALLLSTSADVEGDEPAGVLVDVEAARAAATEQTPSEVPEGVFTDLGDGLLHLQP